jgi:hypothetical protein
MGAIRLLGRLGGEGGQEIITVPFTHPMGNFNILWQNDKAVISNYTLDSFRVGGSPATKYVDGVNGNDSSNGDSWATAYKTFSKAMSINAARTYIKAGFYNSLSDNVFQNTNSEWICDDGQATIMYGYKGSERTWTNQGGGVYSCTFTVTNHIIIDNSFQTSENIPSKLTKKNTLEEVQAEAGTWYYSTNVLYVRTQDGRQPDANIGLHIAPGWGTQSFPASCNYYFKNITFIGGLNITNASANQVTLAMKSCKLAWTESTSVNLLNISGTVNCWIEDCVGYHAYLDLFNYHCSGSYICNVIETGTVAKYAGEGNSTVANNASTAHETTKIIRLNCNYSDTKGVVVHDVGNVESLNINVYSKDSTSTDTTRKAAFGSGGTSGDATKMYLYRCATDNDDTYGAINVVPATSHIYSKKSTIYNLYSGTILEEY